MKKVEKYKRIINYMECQQLYLFQRFVSIFLFIIHHKCVTIHHKCDIQWGKFRLQIKDDKGEALNSSAWQEMWIIVARKTFRNSLRNTVRNILSSSMKYWYTVSEVMHGITSATVDQWAWMLFIKQVPNIGMINDRDQWDVGSVGFYINEKISRAYLWSKTGVFSSYYVVQHSRELNASSRLNCIPRPS